jgi:hypothetical protein
MADMCDIEGGLALSRRREGGLLRSEKAIASMAERRWSLSESIR